MAAEIRVTERTAEDLEAEGLQNVARDMRAHGVSAQVHLVSDKAVALAFRYGDKGTVEFVYGSRALVERYNRQYATS